MHVIVNKGQTNAAVQLILDILFSGNYRSPSKEALLCLEYAVVNAYLQ
jgi:hypothetical protein